MSKSLNHVLFSSVCLSCSISNCFVSSFIIYYIILHILLLTLKGYFLMRDGKEDVQEPDEVDKGKAIITIYYMEKIYFH